jgi:hypothetical protein
MAAIYQLAMCASHWVSTRQWRPRARAAVTSAVTWRARSSLAARSAHRRPGSRPRQARPRLHQPRLPRLPPPRSYPQRQHSEPGRVSTVTSHLRDIMPV